MIEQFNFDIRLIFAILNGKVSAAINRKLYRNFRQGGWKSVPNSGPCSFFFGKKTELHNKSCVMQLLRINPV